MSKIVNTLRILATTDTGLLSWQRSARMAVAKAADEIDRLGKQVMDAHHILDEALGDTDIDGDDSPMFRACQVLAEAISPSSVYAPTGEEAD